jgi:3-hydroxyisobutyrate dehydrogenase-like beta-hydroxyacid dehydrogenase
VIVETSTVTPADARRAAAVCETAGAHFVDAAILSGVKPVMEGTTSLLIGGSPDAVERVRAVLDAITANQRVLGEVGAGMAMKVINNAVAHAVYVVLSEALAMARANGISLPTLTEILREPDAGLLRPLTHRIGERVAAEDFEGGMPVDAARKDSVLALELAQASWIPLFATQAAHTVYELAMAEGMGRLDYSAIATLWDRWERRG